ncbi:hypothetical protein GGR54DRAFT_632966 [Hypoxylon sp. NC1633]|nr:hypothetical protein GGR54DRAFT_632966 [Hypoxylon sp. NC1633]
MSPPINRVRVANACDICKQRKVKCDGESPCSYCKRRQGSLTCHFSPATRRRRARRPRLLSPEPFTAQSSIPSSVRPVASPHSPLAPTAEAESSRPTDDCTHRSDITTEEEADVPREARLLCDARGKSIFIGDCAPLSLFQTIRQIVTSRIDPDAFTPQTSRVSMLENTTSNPSLSASDIGPRVDPSRVARLTVALSCLGGDLGIDTVQAFALITLYMHRACQINGAFLFFLVSWIAARASYSIGLHRTEVNSRFGVEMHSRRDRLWESLRVLDLFLSISMGRPPSMSDIDCTVPLRALDAQGHEKLYLLNALVQVLSITEEIVLQVYSRRKISLQLTEGISRQLRDWSSTWLGHLKFIITGSSREGQANVMGACQVMSSYYYAVMLVARPFLMYELYKRLPDSTTGAVSSTNISDNSGRVRLANACIDAASLMAESVLGLINRQLLDGRSSWLFASSLVLGVGLLGRFGRMLEKNAHMSIAALDYFAHYDAHAMQYSLIAKSLLSSALRYLQRRDVDERFLITESSSQLFGLIPEDRLPRGRMVAAGTDELASHVSGRHDADSTQSSSTHGLPTSLFHDIDPALLSLGWTDQLDPANHVFGALNLFPLLDGNGHIDLAHYL